jgi:rhodanese-related sulfurtransferase
MGDLIELGPADVQARLARGEITLIDVREPNEIAAERIAGTVAMPLSSFDPAQLPAGEAATFVFSCAGGKRSAIAVARTQAAGVPVTAHLRGGLAAWKSAGLPTER